MAKRPSSTVVYPRQKKRLEKIDFFVDHSIPRPRVSTWDLLIRMYNKETIKGAPLVCFGGKVYVFRDVCRADNMEGVRRRVLQERRNPMLIYDEVNFRRSYRLTKATVADLSM